VAGIASHVWAGIASQTVNFRSDFVQDSSPNFFWRAVPFLRAVRG
jgi:hypothetical protein